MAIDYTAFFEDEPEPIDLLEKVASTEIVKHDPMDPAPLLELFVDFKAMIEKMAVEAAAITVTDEASSARCAEMAAQTRKVYNTIEKTRKSAIGPYENITGTVNRYCKPLKDSLDQMETDLESKNQPFLIEMKRRQEEEARKAKEEAARIQQELEEQRRKEQEAAAAEARRLAKIAADREAELAKAKAELEGFKKSEIDRLAKEAAEKAQAESDRLAAEAAAMIPEAPQVVAVEVLPEFHKTETGTQKLDVEWAFEITNFRELPEALFEARGEEILKAVTPWVKTQIKAGARRISGVRIFEQLKVKTRVAR